MNLKTFSTLALIGALGAPAAFGDNLTWVGGDATNPTFWDTLTVNWTGDQVTYLDGDDVTFDDTASSFLVEMQAQLSPNSITFNNTANTYTIAGGNTGFTGATTVTLNSGANVIFSMGGANDWSGLTTIASGATLSIGDGVGDQNSWGLGAIQNDGTLILNEVGGGGEGIIGDGFPGSGPGGDSLSGTGDVDIQNGVLVMQGPYSYTGSTTVSATGGVELRHGGGFGSTGTGTVVNGGLIWTNGIQSATHGNLSEPLTLNAGTIDVRNGNTAALIPSSLSILEIDGPITIGTGGDATLRVRDNTDDPGTSIGATVSGNIGGSNGNGLVTNVGSGSTLLISGNVSHNGSLTKTGGGTTNITGAKSYTGNTIVNGGTLDLGGTHTVASGQALSGNGGTLGNSAVAQSGGSISVGDGTLTGVNDVSVSATYVDAIIDASLGTVNTTLADGTAATAGVDYDVQAGGSADDRWDVRPFGNGPGGGSVISNNGNEDNPALAVTIDGLTPGQQVEVYAYTWGAGGVSWRMRADLVGPDADGTADGQVDQGWNTNHFAASSFDTTDAVTRHITGGENGGPLSTDDNPGGEPAFENGGLFTNGVGVVETVEGNRALYQATLGMATADGNGEIIVYIDDLANNSSANRTFFDGVGYGTTTVLPSFVENIQILTIDGDLDLQAGSSLDLEVLADNVYDKLAVTGALTANGAFNLTLGSGSADLEAGDVIDFLDFASISGTFSAVNLPSLAGGLSWDQSNLLIDGTLSVVSGFDPADLDQDGDVDDADFGIAFAAFTGPNNGPSSNPAADLDGDGDVDDADFGIAFAAFTGPNPATVPEPTSLALLGLGGLLVARRRRA